MKKIIKLTEKDLERIVKKTLNESHENTDEGKMEYIQSALSNLSTNDLDLIYNMVEKLDPNYDTENPEYSREWMKRGGVHF